MMLLHHAWYRSKHIADSTVRPVVVAVHNVVRRPLRRHMQDTLLKTVEDAGDRAVCKTVNWVLDVVPDPDHRSLDKFLNGIGE